MESIIGSTLWITLIGMGLVFIAILILWGLMEIVVRATADKKAKVVVAEPAAEVITETPAAQDGTRKVRAAAAAVAFALSNRRASLAISAPPPTGSGSAWQAVMRSFQLNSRGQLSARKSRGKLP